MRKLITSFMLTKIGTNWTKETLPQAVKEDIDKNGQRNLRKAGEGYTNTLYSIDFIKLKNMLFDPYPQNSNIDQLRRKIEQAEDINDLELSDLKTFVPKSNWERYFVPKRIVDYPEEKLTDQWERLYQLRCQIAHNRTLDKKDFDEVVSIVDKLRDVLQKATDVLPEVHIPEAEQEVVAESLASNINELYGNFIVSWKKLENALLEKSRQANLLKAVNRKQIFSFRSMLELLLKKRIITKEQYYAGRELNYIRNNVVHNPDIAYSEGELIYFTQSIVEYLSLIMKVLDRYEQESGADNIESKENKASKENDGEKYDDDDSNTQQT